MINVVDSRFFKTTEEGLAETTPKQKEQNSKLTNFEYGKSNPDFKRPQYSISMAHTLAVASKLIYEDVAVVKYELEKAGFDVEHTFKAIGYKVKCNLTTCLCLENQLFLFLELLCLCCGKE